MHPEVCVCVGVWGGGELTATFLICCPANHLNISRIAAKERVLCSVSTGWWGCGRQISNMPRQTPYVQTNRAKHIHTTLHMQTSIICTYTQHIYTYTHIKIPRQAYIHARTHIGIHNYTHMRTPGIDLTSSFIFFPNLVRVTAPPTKRPSSVTSIRFISGTCVGLIKTS